MADDAGAENDEREWRFSVDEVGEDDDGPTVAFDDGETPEADDDESGGNVAGSVAVEVPVESDTPELESAVFVGAGALLILLVFASIPATLTPTTIGTITLAVAAMTGILYATFVRF